MYKNLINTILASLLALNVFATDQTIINKLYFRPIAVSGNLPSAEVQQVYRDREGLMWLSTRSGLCSYDGYQVKTYRSTVNYPNLFQSNNIWSVSEDKNFNLWIGTNSGLYTYNKRSGIMRRMNRSLSDPISKVYVDKNNDVWIGTNSGLIKYISQTNTFLRFTDHNHRALPSSYSVTSIIQTSDGSIIMGTWANGLFHISSQNNTVQAYPKFDEENSAHTLFQDRKGRLWVGTWNCGLYRIDNPQDVLHPSIHAYRNSSNPFSLSDNIVYSINEDPVTNTLWVGTRSGLSIMDINDEMGHFTNYTTTSISHPLPCNEINSIVTDGYGGFWIGTIGDGVLQTSTRPSFFTTYDFNAINQYVPAKAIRCIHPINSHLMWIGIGSYGMALYDRSTRKAVFCRQLTEFSGITELQSITAMQTLKNGETWFATHGEGIITYKKGQLAQSHKSINCKFLFENNVLSLYHSQNGAIWIGQFSGLSVALRDMSKGYIVNFMREGGKNLSHCSIVNISEDKVGNIWLATEDEGIIRVTGDPWNPRSLKFHHYSPDNGKLKVIDVVSVVQDTHRPIIWAISKSGGLLRLDTANDRFVAMNDIYHIPDDNVRSIIEDNYGNLWLGTNYGIVKVSFGKDIEHPAVQILTVLDGLQDNYCLTNSVAKFGNEIFFGSYKGMCSFVPNSSRIIKTMKPSIVITDLKIFDRSYSELDSTLRHRISAETPSFTRRIVIPAAYNNFTLEFSALVYAHSEQCKYAYQLEGYDKQWRYVDASHRYAYYNNLPSGKYKFHLKATNPSGIWFDMPYEVTVIVKPPFYATWWAYLFYCIVIASIAYMAHRISQNRLKLKNSLKMEEMKKEQIEKLNQAKLQFFTNITHELLTPLAIISASMEHLKMSIKQDSEDFGVMKSNISRLIRLIQQILEFRKAQTGNLKLKVSEGNVAEFVQHEIDSFAPLMKKKGVNMSFNCKEKEIRGYFDRDKLDKVIYNLLSNAAKYNKKDGNVWVELQSTDNNGSIILTVKDTGIGLSDEAKTHLFERFYDGEYRKSNTVGTGIGLSLTKDLITLHHGTISVDSTLGEGTTFIVTLPIGKSSFGADQFDSNHEENEFISINKEEEIDDEEESDNVTTDDSKPNILIVEDNAELLSLMSKMLRADYNISTATNGKEGLEQVEAESIDLIVTDVMMPVMDGMELTHRIKEDADYCHIPVILLTAKTKDEDREEGYNVGADGFITKPFQLSVLHARIKNLLEARNRVQTRFKDKAYFELKELEYTNLDQDFLQRAIDCVNQHLDDTEFDQQAFVEEMGTSKSTLYNKLKSLTGLNTSAFITNIRLKAACKVIQENPNIRISDLAYMVGFNNPKYFSTCFKKEFGMLVKEYAAEIISKE